MSGDGLAASPSSTARSPRWSQTRGQRRAAGRSSQRASQSLHWELLLHAQHRGCFYRPLKSHRSLPCRSKQYKHHLALFWVTSTCEHSNEPVFLKQLNPGPCARAPRPAASPQTCKGPGRNMLQDPQLHTNHRISPLLPCVPGYMAEVTFPTCVVLDR